MKAKTCQAKEPAFCRYHTKNRTEPYFLDREGRKVEISRGQYVIKNQFKTGDFAKKFNDPKGTNSHFDGSWEELEQIVVAHKHDFEPGTGSVGNDVILVNVPAEKFYTSIVEITPENAHLVEEREHVRNEGEKPVAMKFIKRDNKTPAKFVQVVCYRADVLAQDNDRSTSAEWEIIAVNAQLDKVTPMHPTTMLRNANHDEGGTLREYTEKEWADAYAYWENHAYIDVSK